MFFRVKWLRPAMNERYLLCAAVVAGVVLVPPLCSATSGCSCVRSSMRFLNVRLQIALEWLHEETAPFLGAMKEDTRHVQFASARHSLSR